jgi:fatty acid amide hydrolase 2
VERAVRVTWLTARVTATARPTLPLTRRSALDLAAAIRAGEASAREVVEAHVEALRRAQPRTGALAADRFADALRDADAADERRAADEPDGLPPLHGVPCTVKESFAVAGMPNTAGLVARREHRAAEDAPAVARLRAAGAIPLGVTNTSEMTMWIESSNHVYGRTSSAYDPSRTAGGSSGGEGAAVGSGGSPFGLGTDIGGSVRLPAFCNGVFAHKPSCGVVPATGHFPAAEGEAARMLSPGPIARRAGDLMPVLRVLAGPDGADPLAREVELRDPAAVDLGALDVVVSEGAWYVPIARELRDARERAADALGAAGARVRRESLRSMRRALELYLLALKDGSPATFAEVLADAGVEGVSLRRSLRGAVRGTGPHTLPTLILIALERVSSRIPDRRVRRALAGAKALRAEVEGVMGDGVLLHPPYARPAPKHGRTVGRAWVITPTAVFNLLQMPVTQVPLGLDDRGLPLGVQVVARHDADEVSIACALELERALGGWVPPS